MRDIMRSMARMSMRMAGIKKINKKGLKDRKPASLFSLNWREWVNPRPAQFKRGRYTKQGNRRKEARA